ncbi:ser-thr- gpi-anchored family protein, partial [Fusarium austroafricanum]
MQFTISAAALMAFAAQALAQVADFDPVLTPTNWEKVSAGKTLDITWQAKPKYSGQKISISLIGGSTQNTQVPIKTIATGIDNDAAKYSWAIDSSLGTENVYGLVLKLESNPQVFQYSFPFKIEGGKKEEKPSASKNDYEVPSAKPTKPATKPAYPIPETTVVASETVTVPCNGTAGSPTTFVPTVKTHYPAPPAPPAHNGTAPNPPVYTHPAQPPAVPTQPAG